MNVTINLNGNKTIIDARPDESLLSVLRKNGCISVKQGCNEGFCGSCTVLFNDAPVASCKIPIGIINNSEIVTLEKFKETEEYDCIKKGFDLAGITLCGYCDSGKILLTYQLLKNPHIPTREEITNQVKDLSPCCTDLITLVNGILLAIEIKNKGYETVRNMMRKR